MKKALLLLSICTLFLCTLGGEQKKCLNKAQLIQKMQKGGLVMYFRHASTEKDYADQVNADVNNGSTQRVLSEKGWHEAVQIGHAIRHHKIPVSEVLTSEYFRAWQTAWLAFGRYEKRKNLNFLPYEDYSAEQVAVMKKRVNPYLANRHNFKGNLLIVAHDDPFEATTGIYPKPMGVCYVIKPLGQGLFTILGVIKPNEW